MFLSLSILALFLGPLTYRLLQKQSGWLDLLDAFIFVTISGLVLFHILPEIIHTGGVSVLVVMALGISAPTLVEKYFHKGAMQAHNTTLFLGILGLVVHAALDGSVLIVPDDNKTAWLLAIGVLLHRFPVGLTIWWLLRPQYGKALPLIVLGIMSAGTIFGAIFAEFSLITLDPQWLAWFQAFIMGSIMHVVIHKPFHDHNELEGQKKENRYVAGIGSLLGILVLSAILLPHWLGYVDHDHEHESIDSSHSALHEDHEHENLNNSHLALHDEHENLNGSYLALEEDHDHEDHENLNGSHLALEEDHDHEDHAILEVINSDLNHILPSSSQEELTSKILNHEVIDKNLDLEPLDHSNETAQTLERFASLALHSAPMLLLAYLLNALMHYVKPIFFSLPLASSVDYFKDTIKGVIYGLPLPICSSNAIKIHQQLLKTRVAQTFATAILISAPLLGVDALLISLPLLGYQFLLLRLGSIILFSVLVAWILGRHFKYIDPEIKNSVVVDKSNESRFVAAIKDGYQEQLDHTAPWVIFGLVIAATLSASNNWAFFEQALWLQVLVMIIVALPFAFCATGITPIVAVLLMAGASPGAVIAFLLIAPSISLELLKHIKEQQGVFAAFSLAMLMCGTAFIIGLFFNQYISVTPLPWLHLHQNEYTLLQYSSLFIVVLLFLSSLLRRGARSFVAELIPNKFLKSHSHDKHKHNHN